MSAGNFGRSFAYCTNSAGIESVVVMPEDVPKERVKAIEGFGSKVELCPRAALMECVNRHCKEGGAKFAHPFDDEALFEGYGSIGLEILEDQPEVDVVVVGVGGGGLISGLAAAIKQSPGGENVRVIGVEPEGSNSMFLSIERDEPAHITPNSFVNGLSPPFAGTKAYQHVKQFVEKVVLVTDAQVKEAMKVFFNDYKLVVESAGAAALASVLFGKVDDIEGKNVIVVVSGGNIDIEELRNVVDEK